jgi:hypothetical protein
MIKENEVPYYVVFPTHLLLLVTSSLFGPNILRSILFSNILNLQPSLAATVQEIRPSEIIVSFVLVFSLSLDMYMNM